MATAKKTPIKKPAAKKVAATKKVKKTPAKKVTAKKVTATRKTKKPAANTPATRTAKPDIAIHAPVVTTAPAIQLPETLPKKETIQPNTVGHLKIWLATGAVVVSVVIVWAFSLQLRSVSTTENSIGLNSPLEDLQVNEFVSDVKNDWSTFQDNVIDLEDTVANTNATTTPTTPTTDELNSLFSEPTQ